MKVNNILTVLSPSKVFLDPGWDKCEFWGWWDELLLFSWWIYPKSDSWWSPQFSLLINIWYLFVDNMSCITWFQTKHLFFCNRANYHFFDVLQFGSSFSITNAFWYKGKQKMRTVRSVHAKIVRYGQTPWVGER